MRYNEGIKQSLDTIFAGILCGGVEETNPLIKDIVNTAKINLSRFKSDFLDNVFQDEYAILYSVITSGDLTIFTEEQLSAIMDNNKDIILDSPYVDLTRITGVTLDRAPSEDEKFLLMSSITIELFKTLSNRYVSEDEFNTSCEIYKFWYKEQFMLEVFQNSTLIIGSGYTEKLPGRRSRTWKGADDANEYYASKKRIIDSLEDNKGYRAEVLNADWFVKYSNNTGNEKQEALFRIPIKEIDSVLRSIRRTEIIEILGGPKCGKTRFANFLAGVAQSAGLNVAIWVIDGNKEEWKATQASLRIRMDTGISIDDKIISEIINDGVKNDHEKVEITRDGEIIQVPKKNIRKLIDAAFLRISVDENFGRVSYIDSTFYLEDYQDILTKHYKEDNPFDVIIIDTPVNVESKRMLGMTERIKETYVSLKNYLNTKMKIPACAIITAQVKQTVVDYMRAHPDETMDITSDGDSSETIKTPDEVICLLSTKEERDAGMTMCYHVASKHGRTFKDFYCGFDYATCYLYSRPELNV